MDIYRIKPHLLFSLLLMIFCGQPWCLYGRHFVLSCMTLNPALIEAGALLFILHFIRPCVRRQHLHLYDSYCMHLWAYKPWKMFCFFGGVHTCLFLTYTFCCAAYHHVFSSPANILKGRIVQPAKMLILVTEWRASCTNSIGLNPGRCWMSSDRINKTHQTLYNLECIKSQHDFKLTT